MFATEKAKAEGLSLKATDYREPCPRCSPNRRKKKDPCLHVTVLSGEVRAYCHHCEWGMTFTDDDDRRDARKAATLDRRGQRTPAAKRWW